MKPKGKSVERDVRYVPVDEVVYPEQAEDAGTLFYRFWCRPLFVVYQKYKNGVCMGYTIYPEGKDIFQFETMIRYCEGIVSNVNLCKLYKND